MKTISYFTIKYKIYFVDFEKKKPKMKIAFLYFVFINICVCILNNKFPNFTYVYFILLLSLFRDEKKILILLIMYFILYLVRGASGIN